MILLKLILAHLLGDFIFQTDRWVADKERQKLKSPFLYVHVLIHTLLVLLFLWDLKLWWIAVLIGITHFVIDVTKLVFQKKKNAKVWFFVDQLLHFLVLVLVALPFIDFPILQHFESLALVELAVALVFLTVPSAIIIRVLLSTWTPVMPDQSAIERDSLSNAGKYIGILERLLVFIFIVVGHWEGVGFMIAAKSVFRFSDLQEAKQRKLTEYVLIGTLLSFSFAIGTGILWNVLKLTN